MSYSFSTAIAVGFEEQFYGNVESGGSVRVCAAILNPGGCAVAFPFTVILNTFENTAGILCRSGHSAILCNFASVSSCFCVYTGKHNNISPLTDSPTDFVAMPNTPLLFQPNERRVCVTIPIEDDDMVEQTESFTVILRGTQDLHEAIRLTQTNGFVVIIDDDGTLITVIFITVINANV